MTSAAPPTFVLVHGAYHGAWCWDLLRPELEHRGCGVIAVDLPADDPTRGAAEYADAVVAAVPAGTQRIVVVGHSLGGLTIPLLPARMAVELLVYLCALAPEPGQSLDSQQPDMDSGFVPSEAPQGNPDGSASWPAGGTGAIEVYYHDCPPDIARWAASRLRPQHWKVTQEVTPLHSWPATPVAYILARDDRALSPRYSRALARERLGVDPVQIEGGHSPFLSRPAVLADLLVSMANRETPSR